MENELQDPTKVTAQFDPLQQRIIGVTNHDRLVIDVPFISHVDGNLWQGGCKNGLVLPHMFDHLFSLYIWESYILPRPLKTNEQIKMYDSVLGLDPNQVFAIAKHVQKAIEDGPTLVHCQAGLNRSSLISGTVLWLNGMPSCDIVEFLREKRGSRAVLCNPAFEDFITNLDDLNNR